MTSQLVQIAVEGRKLHCDCAIASMNVKKGLARSRKFSLSQAGFSLQYQTHIWQGNSEKSQSQSFDVVIESFAASENQTYIFVRYEAFAILVGHTRLKHQFYQFTNLPAPYSEIETTWEVLDGRFHTPEFRWP